MFDETETISPRGNAVIAAEDVDKNKTNTEQWR